MTPEKYLYVHSQIYDGLDTTMREALFNGVGSMIMSSIKEQFDKYPDKPMVRVSISFEPLDKYGV